jgi:uncharacterized protein YdaU (DUF1376 family)
MADPHDTTTPGKSPAFQFYPKDFVTGTLTLTTYEVGAYMLLICYCWDNGSIPKDLGSMARIARISTQQMRRMWVALREKFQEGGDGFVQPRIEVERQKQVEYRRRQTDAVSGGISQKHPMGIPPHRSGITQPHRLLFPVFGLRLHFQKRETRLSRRMTR